MKDSVPALARRGRERTRQRPGRDDLACRKRRIVRIVLQEFDQVQQGMKWTVDDIRCVTAVAVFSIAVEFDFEGLEHARPLTVVSRRDSLIAEE